MEVGFVVVVVVVVAEDVPEVVCVVGFSVVVEGCGVFTHPTIPRHIHKASNILVRNLLIFIGGFLSFWLFCIVYIIIK